MLELLCGVCSPQMKCEMYFPKVNDASISSRHWSTWAASDVFFTLYDYTECGVSVISLTFRLYPTGSHCSLQKIRDGERYFHFPDRAMNRMQTQIVSSMRNVDNVRRQLCWLSEGFPFKTMNEVVMLTPIQWLTFAVCWHVTEVVTQFNR